LLPEQVLQLKVPENVRNYAIMYVINANPDANGVLDELMVRDILKVENVSTYVTQRNAE
jgi:hypothetical protein